MHDMPTPPPETGELTAALPPPTGALGAKEPYDWTEDLPQTDHVRFFRSTDWSRTKLGPLETWDSTLRLFTRLVLADSRAACLWWGPDYVAIYNEAYMPLSAQAHPKLMGSPFIEGYPDLWPYIKEYFDKAAETGRGVDYSSAVSLMVERKGWREEAFFNGNFVPMSSGPTNKPEGFYNSLFEVTSQRLAERRTMMLNRMASVPDFQPDRACDHILKTLETNGNDIPLAMLYETDTTNGPTTLRLRGQIGLPQGHNLLVDGQSIDSDEGIIPDCRLAGSSIRIIDYDERFGSISWRGFGSPSNKIAVLPIISGSRSFGYLIVGTNPCRPFDDECQQFLKDLSRMVSSIIVAAVNAEEAQMRQQQLENDLAFSDTKLRHLIEHASVGMVHISLDGNMLWANDHYYSLCGTTAQEQLEKLAFFDVFIEEDKPTAKEVWESLVKGANHHVSVELRLKRLYTSPVGDPEPAQIQVLAFPYREDGQVKSIMACATDISKLKWAQTFQARLAAEAREAKRQQEAFIDVVSHEMRNPLSAIVHCADGISNSLEEYQSKTADTPQQYLDVLKENVSSANIIMECAHHQKRIIDDVLTLSKLDSMLLSITPSAVKPAKLINSIVAIFEAELKSNGIRYDIKADPSIFQASVDYLYLDPSRVTQIFINLLTNAIKFVKTTSEPRISIRYGASLFEPRNLFPSDMFWADKSKDFCDVTANSEWGHGEEVFLTFMVKDTGIGLKGKEIHKIFERFGQANVRTHVKYGGSGLGLFISKELSEKQGGEIGVSSSPGEGSTFGFYVKTRRVERKPQTLSELMQQSSGTEDQQQLHVLLVEDNLINQKVLGKQLRKAGCTVEVANHGLEALNTLEKSSFDVVLMDLEMPVLDGLSAMREIRKKQHDGKLPEPLPIIAVTANVRQEQIMTAMDAGADRVMQKPFRAVDLVNMMKDLVPQVTTPGTEPGTPGLSERLNEILG